MKKQNTLGDYINELEAEVKKQEELENNAELNEEVAMEEVEQEEVTSEEAEIEAAALDNKNKEEDKKTGRRLIAMVATLMAAVTAISCYLYKKEKNKKAEDEIIPQTTIEETTTTISMDNLGVTEELKDNNLEYGKTTGDVVAKDIVEKDGVNYKNQAAADKSNQVGQTKIDLQNGKLEVKPNGEVFEKETGYTVVDKQGNVVAEGSNEQDLLNDYITIDRNYYFKDGSLVFSKGELVPKAEFEKYKAYLTTEPKNVITNETTTKPVETTKAVTTTQPKAPITDELGGVKNADGTYTIEGLTYMDRATFEAFIIDENSRENFRIRDGVIYPMSVIREMDASKTR